MFLLQARKNSLTVRSWELLSSGSVNENHVQFQFSEDWDGLSRTAVFSAGEVSRSVLLAEDTMCAIPWEVLAEPRLRLYMGVYGVGDGGETVLPTVWADLGEIYPGAVPDQDAQPPTPDLWQQELANYATNASVQTAIAAALANYMSSVEVNQAIADAVVDAGGIRFEAVEALPETGEAHVIYLVPSAANAVNNAKDEYIWLDGKWELFGSAAVDLSGYWTKIKAALDSKQDLLIPDETILIKDGGISVKTPVKPLTQAEYDALDSWQKHNTAFVITDVEPSVLRGVTIQEYDTEDGWHVRKWADGYVELLADKSKNIGTWGSITPGVTYSQFDSMPLPFPLVKKYETHAAAFDKGTSGAAVTALQKGAHFDLLDALGPLWLISFSTPPPSLVGITIKITGRWK